MKDKWKKMKEELHKSVDPKHGTLYVANEVICGMNVEFFLAREREKRFVGKLDALGATVTHCKLSKILTRTRRSTRANYTKLGISGGATKSPVANWGAHSDVSEGKFPRNLRK